MAIPSFFKQNKPRGFNYIPRYFDPAKEEMEQRRRLWSTERDSQVTENRTEGEKEINPDASETGANKPYRSRIMRGDMKNYFHHRKEKVRKQTTIRLIVILIIIFLVVYLYLRF